MSLRKVRKTRSRIMFNKRFHRLPQETKFKEALKYYEMIVQKHTDNILSVSAIVLANLCVSYIMTSQVRL